MIDQAVVLVGGLGTRLGSLTAETPKPLLPVAGRPFLCWQIEDLLRQGVSEILLLAGYRAEQLSTVGEQYPGVKLIVEPTPLGTGGALRFAADHLAERFFFLNGDSLFDMNLWDLALHGASADAILALRPVDDVSRYGPAELDGDRIVHFAERPERGGAGLINGGVGLLSRHLLEMMPPKGAVSIEREIYPVLAREGRLRGRTYRRPFIDIGVPDDFDRSQTLIPQTLTRGAVILPWRDLAASNGSDVLSAQAAAGLKTINDAGFLALVSGFAGPNPADVNSFLRRRGAQVDVFVAGDSVDDILREITGRRNIALDRSVFAATASPLPAEAGGARATPRLEGDTLIEIVNRALDAGPRG